jgi:hypothetical protein
LRTRVFAGEVPKQQQNVLVGSTHLFFVNLHAHGTEVLAGKNALHEARDQACLPYSKRAQHADFFLDQGHYLSPCGCDSTFSETLRFTSN